MSNDTPDSMDSEELFDPLDWGLLDDSPSSLSSLSSNVCAYPLQITLIPHDGSPVPTGGTYTLDGHTYLGFATYRNGIDGWIVYYAPGGSDWYIGLEGGPAQEFNMFGNVCDPPTGIYSATGAGSGNPEITLGPESSSSVSSQSSVSSSSVSSSSVSSVSSVSSLSSVNSSSSSVWERDGYPPSYVSKCESLNDISHPLVGADKMVYVLGNFDVVPADWDEAYDDDNQHLRRGGLQKTSSNQGRIVAANASSLVSLLTGMISLRLNLPYAIVNGVYAPLASATEVHLNHNILFGITMGEHYITVPGIYAALTPTGILFEIWSSEERAQLMATNVDVAANTDFTISFAWDANNSLLVGRRDSMAIVVNDELIAHKRAKISLSQQLGLIDGVSLIRSKLYLLDTPTAKSNLECIIRRIETYPYVQLDLLESESSSSSSSSSSSVSEEPPRSYSYRGKSSLPFASYGGVGNGVIISDISFPTVVKHKIDLYSTGGYGAGEHAHGVEDSTNKPPDIPKDLTLGIREVRPKQ